MAVKQIALLCSIFFCGCLFSSSDGPPTSGDTGQDQNESQDTRADTREDTGGFDTTAPDGDQPDGAIDMGRPIPLVLIVNDPSPEPTPCESSCTFTGALAAAADGFAADGTRRTIRFDFGVDTVLELVPTQLSFPVEILGSVEPNETIEFRVPAESMGAAMSLAGGSRVESIRILGVDTNIGIAVRGSSTVVFNTLVAGFERAISVTGDGHEIDDCVIGLNPTAENGIGPTEVGLYIDGDADSVVVSKNDILRNTQYGVHVTAPTTPSMTPIEFTANNIRVNDVGVRIERAFVTFIGNRISANEGHGVDVAVGLVEPAIEDRAIVFEGNQFGVNFSNAVIGNQGDGLHIDGAPAVRIGGPSGAGCVGECNVFVGNGGHSAFLKDVDNLVIQGNTIGVGPTEDNAANGDAFEISYTRPHRLLVVGSETLPADVPAVCDGGCNRFANSPNDGLRIVYAITGEVRGNYYGVLPNAIGAISRAGIQSTAGSGLTIAANFFTAMARGIGVSGEPISPTATSFITNNVFGGPTPSTLCGANQNERLDVGIIFNDTTFANVGTWEVRNNRIRCTETDAVDVRTTALTPSIIVADNVLGEDVIGDSGVFVATSNVRVENNEIARTGRFGVEVSGAGTINVDVIGNQFGFIDGILTPTLSALTTTGFAVSVGFGAGRINITNNRFDGYERGIRGSNVNSAFYYHDNTFARSLTTLTNIVGSDSTNVAGYAEDLDIGANAALNPPNVATQAIGTLAGDLTVPGALVHVYRSVGGGDITLLPNGGGCSYTDDDFSCSEPGLVGDLFLTQTARLFRTTVEQLGTNDYSIVIDGVAFVIPNANAQNRNELAEELREASAAAGVLINHSCEVNSTTCELWIQTADGRSINVLPRSTFSVVENRGLITSEFGPIN